MVTKIEEEIESYSRAIKMGEYPKPGEQCPRCKENPGEFKLHDQRKRKFRVVVEALVKVIITVLIRWKCPLCKKTFSMYPSFAVAHKQYTLPQILEISERYLKQKEVCYEDAPREGELRIGYLGKPDSFLAGSTVWRWVGWLGSLHEPLSKALDLIRQKCPSTTDIFRRVEPAFGNKYKSDVRRIVVGTAMRVLSIFKEYEKIFHRPFFPQFAIRQ